MDERPKIKVEFGNFDQLIEVLGWFAVIFSWIFILIKYQHLPAEIPTHFNFSGEPDAWGDKSTLLFDPLIASVLFIALTVLNKFPHKFNYPVQITDLNAEKQYTLACRLVRILKLGVVLIFLLIAMETIHVAENHQSLFGVWFTVALLIIIIIPLVFYFVQVYEK